MPAKNKKATGLPGATLIAVRGQIVNWPQKTVRAGWSAGSRLQLIRDGVVVYDSLSGVIEFSGPAARLPRPLSRRIKRTTDYKDGLLFPGMTDLHVHLTQLGAIGSDGYELLPWLSKFIFPLEKSLTAPKSKIYAEKFFDSMFSLGTTTAVVYAPAYPDSVNACFEAARQKRARVYMGQTLMDQGNYRKGGKNFTERLLAECEEQIQAWHGKGRGLLNYIITPRFAISCSETLMRGCGELSQKHGVFLQTHLSENTDEIKTVLKMYPKAKSYSEVYDRNGCLHERSIMAHCIHLSADEKKLLRKRGAAIAYCPSSNLFLQSGILDVNSIQAAGIPFALGSDIAGGTDLSMLETIKISAMAQKARGFTEKNYRLMSNQQTFYLATAAAGRILQNNSGHLNRGAPADFFVVQPRDLDPLAGAYPKDMPTDLGDILSRLLYAGPRPVISETFVAGRRVYRRKFKLQ